MKIGWIGVHAEGLPAFQAICEADYDVTGVITLPPEQAASRCGSVPYGPACEQYGVPLFEVGNINSDAGIDTLRQLNADVVFVLGWGQILHAEALRQARIGMVGAHASLLPHNRGSAPVNWAIIRGETVTGNSLIWLSEGVDCGSIIDQRQFPLHRYDTCATIYDLVAESNREMVLNLLPRLALGEKPGQPQPETDEDSLPRRRPQDGLIDWSVASVDVYNLIRALAKPYPGASGYLHGQLWKIWKAAHLPHPLSVAAAPGTVLGPVYSPETQACGQLVACGDGAVLLLEIQDPQGQVWTGRDLSELSWQGKAWKNAA